MLLAFQFYSVSFQFAPMIFIVLTNRVEKVSVTLFSMFVLVSFFNWAGIERLGKEARTIPNAKSVSFSAHRWNDSWQVDLF